MASTAGKIKEAKVIAKYRTNELKKMQTNKQNGGLSMGGTVVSTAKSRTAGLNAVNSAAKTAGRAKNVESKLKKVAAPAKTSSIARKYAVKPGSKRK